MIYRLYPQTGTRFFTEKNGRCRIPYLPVKRMRERYPDGNFVIIGEIGGLARTPPGQDTLLIGGKKVSVFPRGGVCRPFEWIAGYVAVEANTYVAAVRNLFPAFLWCRKRKRMERSECQTIKYTEEVFLTGGRKNPRIL